MFLNQYNLAVAATLYNLSKGTKISITLDAQSAANYLSFLAINRYYINNNQQLKETLLNFLLLRRSHTRESIAVEVLQVIKHTNTTQKLLAITCDNASNNSTLTQSIQHKLLDKDIAQSPSKNLILCLAYIINLIMQDIIYYLKLLDFIKINNNKTL